MKKTDVRKLALAALLVAAAVACSPLAIPVGVSRCFPAQHLVNVLAAVLLGPVYGVEIAFVASLIRVLLSTGTLLAFPGSMCGALLCALVYKKTKNITLTCLAEVFGTGVIGGLLAYPMAYLLMNNDTAVIYGFIFPFALSSAGGAVIAFIVLQALKKVLVRKGLLHD